MQFKPEDWDNLADESKRIIVGGYYEQVISVIASAKILLNAFTREDLETMRADQSYRFGHLKGRLDDLEESILDAY